VLKVCIKYVVLKVDIMNLVVDKGNTRIKFALFDEFKIVCKGRSYTELLTMSESSCYDTIISVSGILEAEFRQLLEKNAALYVEANPLMKLPIGIKYSNRETLGFDRIADCVGAYELYRDNNLLVIDIGTAITYNYIDVNGNFIGGNISPGLDIRFSSLHEHTAKLPLLKSTLIFNKIGNSTETAIVSGVINGMIFEVLGYIDEFIEQNNNSKVIITGGYNFFIKGKVKQNIIFNDDLGLIGLNKILEYHKKMVL